MSAATTSQAPLSYMAQRSAWHSPVPYLFGGLAAMLGLIAFALLLLACSYWKLSGQINDDERDLEAGEGGEKMPPVLEEKYLVIMAGQVNPTFLATPMSSRASSFGSVKTTNSSSTTCSESSTLSIEDKKDNNSGQVEMGEAHQDLESPVHQV